MNEQMYLDLIELMEYEAEIALATKNVEDTTMNEQMYLDWIEPMEYEAEIALATINDEYMKQCESLLPF